MAIDTTTKDQLRAEQLSWLAAALRDADANVAIRHVIVAGHHPACTNSSIVRASPYVRDGVQPLFVAHQKTRLLLAGHAHGYERFARGDKHLIVAGGGGGPRFRLRPPRDDRHVDACTAAAIRPFHYLTIDVDDAVLRVQVHGLNKGESTWFALDAFNVG